MGSSLSDRDQDDDRFNLLSDEKMNSSIEKDESSQRSSTDTKALTTSSVISPSYSPKEVAPIIKEGSKTTVRPLPTLNVFNRQSTFKESNNDLEQLAELRFDRSDGVMGFAYPLQISWFFSICGAEYCHTYFWIAKDLFWMQVLKNIIDKLILFKVLLL